MKTILFDLDGTLVDSGPGIMNCVRHAYATLGIEAPEESIVKTFVGPPLRDSFARNRVPEDLVEEAITIFRKQYQITGKYEVTPYPGIEDMLKKLSADGHHLCIATSKPEVLANDILGRLGMAHYFRLICGATMDASRESKADVISYLLSQKKGADSAIMVGDTHFDTIGANAHGMRSVGVSWGYGSVDLMKDAGACAIADDAERLYEILTDL